MKQLGSKVYDTIAGRKEQDTVAMSAGKYPNPEVQPKPQRRRFSAEYKQRILTEVDQCQHGEIGQVLRREGLYHGQIAL